MSETDWLTSTNPAEMWAFIKDRVTERQMRFFVEACRANAHDPWGYRTENIVWKDLAEEWCGRIVEIGEINPSVVAEILRDIVGNPFRPYTADGGHVFGMTCKDAFTNCNHPYVAIHADVLAWNDGTIPKMIDAMLYEDCSECEGWGVHHAKEKTAKDCSACNGKGRIHRAEPRWSDMPIIADALETAGCHEQAILEHLRLGHPGGVRCAWCGGAGWRLLDEEAGYDKPTDCSHCKGTGRREGRHWRGCFALELLRGTT